MKNDTQQPLKYQGNFQKLERTYYKESDAEGYGRLVGNISNGVFKGN